MVEHQIMDKGERMRFGQMMAVSVVVGGLAATASATPAFLQPDEAGSKDSWVYPGFGPTEQNPSFAAYLAAGIATGQAGVINARAFVQYDLTGLSIDANEQVTVGFTTRTSPFGSADPSTALPLPIGLHRVTQAWDEATVSAAAQPAFLANPSATAVLSGVGQIVTFDITSLAQSWISDPSSNFGFALVAPQQVGGPTFTTTVLGFFASSRAGNPADRPFLQISVIPEPATLGLLTAIGAMGLSRRRR
jgi:hypothetical protein